MNIPAPDLELPRVANPVIRKASLPDRHLRADLVGEASLDESHYSLQSEIGRSQEEMDVVRHDDESMQLEAAGIAVALDGLKQQF